MTCEFTDKTTPRKTTGSVAAGNDVDTLRVGKHRLDRAGFQDEGTVDQGSQREPLVGDVLETRAAGDYPVGL